MFADDNSNVHLWETSKDDDSSEKLDGEVVNNNSLYDMMLAVEIRRLALAVYQLSSRFLVLVTSTRWL